MVVETKTIETLEEAISALLELRSTAEMEGHSADVVYLRTKLVLVEETLTDGSKVMNVEVREAA
jgi:hypothetical protein